MSACGSCGFETTRIRTLFERDGKPLPEAKDECPNCAPQSFERFHTPSERKIWMSWEKEPAHYRREYDKDGPIMMPSDSVLQDLQDAVCRQPVEELQAGVVAQEAKRANRRMQPMSADEMTAAINKARSIAFDIEAYHRQAARDRELMAEATKVSVN